MPYWTRSKVGIWLLISLLPSFVLGVVLASVFPDPEGFWNNTVGPLLGLYVICALIAGVILTVLGRIDGSRAYREAQQYAEMHGWFPITKTSWRNRKRDNVQLAVDQSFKKSRYILKIDHGEATVIDEFETAYWALQFGDWLWEQLLGAGTTKVDAETVSEKRAEWEGTRAMAVYRPSTPTRRAQYRVQETRTSENAGGYTVQGQILQFSMQAGGIILGDDGQRYTFNGTAWNTPGTPMAGQRVNFMVHGDQATDIFAISGAPGSKSKIVAAAFAFFLGGVGGHKFYLGHTGLGILYICLTITILGAIFFTAPASLIETIIYLTKSDEDFERIYVQERRPLF